MRIAVAGDHAGWSLKEEIKGILAGHEISDFGTTDDAACDLPDFVYPAALAVGGGQVDRGIFVDGVGYGSAMIANKVPGVYAAVCQDPFCATLALETVNAWLSTHFVADVPKNAARVDKVRQIADKHVRPGV